MAKAYANAVEPHLTITLPSELKPGATRENAAAITAWLHKHVQYSDADLEAGPIDGLDLSAVLKRGTANANEQAALLTALLRAVGIPSEIWLARPALAAQLDGPLPDLEAFDQPVLRVVAEKPFIIDPRYRHSPTGFVTPLLRNSSASGAKHGW